MAPPADVFRLRMPTPGGEYTSELVWARRLSPTTARILSVVRYATVCQFGDLVRHLDGNLTEVLERTDLTMHEITGPMTTPAAAQEITAALREQDITIEVWSWTMGGNPPQPAPLHAGVMVSDPRAAVAALAGLGLCYPTLLAVVGDELGARRHAKERERRAAHGCSASPRS